jgi:hypothetical protein
MPTEIWQPGIYSRQRLDRKLNRTGCDLEVTANGYGWTMDGMGSARKLRGAGRETEPIPGWITSLLGLQIEFNGLGLAFDLNSR